MTESSGKDSDTMPENQGNGAPLLQCPVVALGTSAGGLEVLKSFFEHMPVGSGLAFVVIQHLDPNYQSLVPHLLRGHTEMEVRWVGEGDCIAADTIYLVRSRTQVGVKDCAFTVTERSDDSARLRSIDETFQSLAAGLGTNLIGIVASGLGSDGTVGLYAVKEHGGLAMAQAVDSAAYSGMPESAVAAGLVDVVLRVEEMPRLILDYVRTLANTNLGKALEQDALDAVMPKIFEVLRGHSGHDFGEYKDSTLVRRVQRRMRVCHKLEPAAYLQHLQEQPGEAEALFKDLLIGVTRFFRDTESFGALASRVVEALLDRCESGGSVRIWVPGCATGEEAYSIGMLFLEGMERQKKQCRIQIFATDLDGRALEVARRGIYPDGEVQQQLSAERRRKFLIKRGASCEVIPTLRQMCSFSVHNLIKDPPFSRLDLISCRNVLIYLEADLQRRLLPIFHFALNPNGFLFLGPSEHIVRHSEQFAPIDQKNRIFQRKPTALPNRFQGLSNGSATRRMVDFSSRHGASQQPFTRMVERVLLEGYAPPAVVINDRGEALYFSGKAGRFLEMPTGAPSTSIVGMARRGLRLELRRAVHRAVTTGEEVVCHGVNVSTPQGPRVIDLAVRPMPELADQGPVFIVIFMEQVVVPVDGTPAIESRGPVDDEGESGAWSHLVQQLENELQAAKEDLQATIEELETSNEELQSANEELLSMNEELQSANEELQSSKEEVQSINEELERSLEEVDSSRVALQNLLAASELAAVFLDLGLRIKSVTPALADLVGIDDGAIGKRFAEVAEQVLPGSEIAGGVHRVLRENATSEQQIYLEKEKRWLLVRLMPYRNLNGDVQGVVLSFFDVTHLKRTQQDLQEANVAIYRVLDRITDGFAAFDGQWHFTYFNEAARRLIPGLLNRQAEDLLGRSPWDEFPGMVGGEIYKLFRKAIETGLQQDREVFMAQAGVWLALRIYPSRDGLSLYFRDVTEERQARDALRLSQERLALALSAGHMGAWDWDVTGGRVVWSGALEEMHGYAPGTFPGTFEAYQERIHPEDREMVLAGIEACRGQGTDLHQEYRLLREDGTVLWIESHGRSYRDDEGKIHRMAGICADVTQRKLAEAALREAQVELSRYASELEGLVGERTVSLRETIDSLESVCYTIAHDLRAPLRTMQGFTQILMQRYGQLFDEEGRDLAERMVRAASRMDALIRDLLNYAKLSHGELPVAPLDLEADVRGILASMQPEIDAAGASVNVERLPSVMANAILLEQVLANLIGNALKFRREGVAPELTIEAEPERDGMVRVWVRDNGIGIKSEYRERIFGLFQRLDSSASYPGTGIGLSIVKKGVERMGGRVGVESTVGEGSAFYLDLPADKA